MIDKTGKRGSLRNMGNMAKRKTAIIDRDKLISDNMRLISWFIGRYGAGLDPDDLRSTLHEAIVIAARKYDGRAKFSTYAVLLMKQAAYKLRKYNVDKSHHSLDDERVPDKGVILDYDASIDSESYPTITDLLIAMSPKERKAVELRFGLSGQEPMKLWMIGRKMNLSVERVRQIINGAIRDAKQRYQQFNEN